MELARSCGGAGQRQRGDFTGRERALRLEVNQGRAAGMEPKDGITASYLVATEGHSEEVAAGAT